MEPVAGETYQHYKGGTYKILCLTEETTDSREGERGVVYQQLESGRIFHRELREFTTEITLPDGTKSPRFVLKD